MFGITLVLALTLGALRLPAVTPSPDSAAPAISPPGDLRAPGARDGDQVTRDLSSPRPAPAPSDFSSFLPDIQVNYDPGNLVDDFGPAIAVSQRGVIYIVWTGDETMKSILFSRSVDGGVTFSPAVRINDAVAYPSSYSVYQPDIAIDGNDNVYVVWHDYRAWGDDYSWTSPIDVYLDKSTDGGLTWGTDVLASTNGAGTYPWHFQPYIGIDQTSGNIYVSFTDYDRYYPEGDYSDVSVARSTDGGATFAAKVRVDDTADSLLVVQEFSSVAVDQSSGDVYVVFEDTRGSGRDIYLARSADDGQSFLANARVNADTASVQEQPSVAVDDAGHIYVAWLDWRNDPDPQSAPYQDHIYVARSTNACVTFAPSVQVTDAYMNADYSYDFPPRLAAGDPGEIHVVWFDRRTDKTFCYRDRSTDGGQTFSVDAIIHDNLDSLTHGLPRVAVDGHSDPVMTWMDRRNGNGRFDVFFTGVGAATAVADAGVPIHSLGQNYPNPFNPHTTVRYTVGEDARVRLRVYNGAGHVVRTLVDETVTAGEHTASWDGRDERGVSVASGVYFCRMQAGSVSLERKLVLIR
jgi:hypothetical protein